MHSAIGNDRARWAIAAVGALLVLAALLFLIRLPPAPQPSRPVSSPTPPSLQIAKSATGDAVLAQELILRDMRPLFLPTEQFNVSLPEPRREPGRTFLGADALKLTYSEAELDLEPGLPPLATINGKVAHVAKPIDAVGREAGEVGLQGFGRAPASFKPPPPRGAIISVTALANGREVLTEVLPIEARPAGNKQWEPMELLASLDAAGLIAPLAVTSSSRVDEVDAHFRNFLAQTYRIGDRLPPGLYRITVGP